MNAFPLGMARTRVYVSTTASQEILCCIMTLSSSQAEGTLIDIHMRLVGHKSGRMQIDKTPVISAS